MPSTWGRPANNSSLLPESMNEQAPSLAGVPPSASMQSVILTLLIFLGRSIVPQIPFLAPVSTLLQEEPIPVRPPPRTKLQDECWGAQCFHPGSCPLLGRHLTHLCWRWLYLGKFGTGPCDLVRLVIHFGPKGNRSSGLPKASSARGMSHPPPKGAAWTLGNQTAAFTFLCS